MRSPSLYYLQGEPERLLRDLSALVGMNICMRVSSMCVVLRILSLEIETNANRGHAAQKASYRQSTATHVISWLIALGKRYEV